MSNHVSVHLEMVLVSVQDRCMVCTKRTIGPEIILDAPEELVSDVGHVESCFGLFWRQCWCRCKIGAWFAPNVP